jgi:nucleotide-binding universal stress UspA family protein
VTIVIVRGDKELTDKQNVAITAGLDRIGLQGEVMDIEIRNKPIGEALQDFALQQGAGLLVMGAFGHSRLRQFVLGGATSDVLNSPRIPTLMSY